MTEHTRTDGLAGMALPPQELPPEPARPGGAARLQCHACPVLCQIAPGRAGACDRYANRDGALVRLHPLVLPRKTLDAGLAPVAPFAPRGAAAGALVRLDPLVLLRKTLDPGAATLVPFAPRGAGPGAAGGADASADTAAPWSGDLLHADEVFVTGVGASTTYPDYKPAPFIVGSRVQGVDMVTVVTEGIFSYCSFKVKIDTDRFLGPEQAPVRCQGEAVGHVTTAEYGSQMLSLGGVQHLTGGSRKEGRITAELMQRLGNKQAVELGIDA